MEYLSSSQRVSKKTCLLPPRRTGFDNQAHMATQYLILKDLQYLYTSCSFTHIETENVHFKSSVHSSRIAGAGYTKERIDTAP